MNLRDNVYKIYKVCQQIWLKKKQWNDPNGVLGLITEQANIMMIFVTWNLCSTKETEYCLILKSNSHLPKTCVICFIESPLKMMKNAFYFILKALFVLKIFKFLSWLFGHIEKTAWLERED